MSYLSASPGPLVTGLSNRVFNRLLNRLFNRLFRPVLVVVGVAVLACGTDDPNPGSDEHATEPRPGAETPTPEDSRSPSSDIRRRAGLRPFWHDDDLVGEMGLEPAQVENMETLLYARQTDSRTVRQATTALRTDFARALAAGDWQLASRHSEALAAAAAAAVEADTAVKMEILSQLTGEQRRLLLERQPSALRRSWLAPGLRRTRPTENPLLDD